MDRSRGQRQRSGKRGSSFFPSSRLSESEVMDRPSLDVSTGPAIADCSAESLTSSQQHHLLSADSSPAAVPSFNNAEVAAYLLETFKTLLATGFPTPDASSAPVVPPASTSFSRTAGGNQQPPFFAAGTVLPPLLQTSLTDVRARTETSLEGEQSSALFGMRESGSRFLPPVLQDSRFSASASARASADLSSATEGERSVRKPSADRRLLAGDFTPYGRQRCSENAPLASTQPRFTSSTAAALLATEAASFSMTEAMAMRRSREASPARAPPRVRLAEADSPRSRSRVRSFLHAPRRRRSRSPRSRSPLGFRRFPSPSFSEASGFSSASVGSRSSRKEELTKSAKWHHLVDLAASFVPSDFFPAVEEPEAERLTSIGRPRPPISHHSFPHSKFVCSEASTLNEENFFGQKSASSDFMTRSAGGSSRVGPFFKPSGPSLAPRQFYEGHNQLVARDPSTLDMDFGDWGNVSKNPPIPQLDLKREESFLRSSVRASSSDQVFSEGAFECLRSLSEVVAPEHQHLVESAMTLMEAASEARCHSISAAMRCLANVLIYRRESHIPAVRSLEPFVAKAVWQLPLFPDAMGKKSTSLFADGLESLIDPLFDCYKLIARPPASFQQRGSTTSGQGRPALPFPSPFPSQSRGSAFGSSGPRKRRSSSNQGSFPQQSQDHSKSRKVFGVSSSQLQDRRPTPAPFPSYKKFGRGRGARP